MKKIKLYIIAVLSITLLGEMYFFPFQGDFRFSAGVLAISFILLMIDKVNEIYLGIFTALSVLVFRTIINSFSHYGSIIEILKIDFPAAVYYGLFAILAYISSLREYRTDPPRTIIVLFFIDIFSNIVESLLRSDLNYKLFQYILLIALLRSFISYTIYTLFYRQEILILKKEHQKRYAQQNTLISNIQAEMFYLNKSMKDIEEVMSKSYQLYEDNKDNEKLRKLSLDIAREVHEIKKDYYRVISGFNEFLEDFVEKDSMSFKDISIIIHDNASRYISQNHKNISLNFKIHNNVTISKFYSIFTILNNLIINSIDALGQEGTIDIDQSLVEDNLIIKVRDNGHGIDSDIIDYIFNPGFTTKFDENTGEASTGIGLSHIKSIVDSLGGKIEISSQVNMGSEFIVSIALNSLKG